MPRRGGPARRPGPALAPARGGLRRPGCAGLAAAVSLFTYGGPAGLVLPNIYRLWDTTFYLDSAATAGVVIGLLLMLRSAAAPTAPPLAARALPVLAGVYAAATAVHMLLFATHSVYFGPLGHIRQAAVVTIGLLESLTVVAVFVAARGRA